MLKMDLLKDENKFRDANTERVIQAQSNLAAEFPYLTQSHPDLFRNDEVVLLRTIFDIQFQEKLKWKRIRERVRDYHRKSLEDNLHLAMTGKISQIRAVENKPVRLWLLILSGASGYLDAFESLSNTDIGYSFRCAAEFGHSWVVRALLEKIGHKISLAEKEAALTLASEFGYIDIVKAIYFNAKNKMSDDAKSDALMQGVLNARVEIAAFLFEHLDADVYFPCRDWLWLFSNDKPEMMTMILNHMGKHISADEKGKMLVNAASAGNMDIIELLLNRVMQDVSIVHKNEALKAAMDYNHPIIVRVLVDRIGETISPRNKARALNWKPEPPVVKALITPLFHQAKDPTPKPRINLDLDPFAAIEVDTSVSPR